MTPTPKFIVKHVLTLGGAALLALAVSAAFGGLYADWGYIQKTLTMIGVIVGCNATIYGMCMEQPDEYEPEVDEIERVTRNPRLPVF